MRNDVDTRALSCMGGRYRFECVFNNYLSLPNYPGSILRSAFGAALRRISCVTGRSVCQGCPLIHECTYTKIFEAGGSGIRMSGRPASSSPPYVIESSIEQKEMASLEFKLEFHMVIFGIALKHLPLIVLAWRRALMHGLGKKRMTGRLVRVVRSHQGIQDECIWSEDQPRVIPHKPTINLDVPVGKQEIIFCFNTPLRLQRKGKVLGSQEIMPADLMTSCLRRFSELSTCAEKNIDRKNIREMTERAKHLQDQNKLRYVQFSRYSSRQKRKMELPGLIGYWSIRGDLRLFLPALYFCEIFHVGKNTSIGLGKYSIVPDSASLN